MASRRKVGRCWLVGKLLEDGRPDDLLVSLFQG